MLATIVILKTHTQSAAGEIAVNLRFKIQHFAFKPTDTLTTRSVMYGFGLRIVNVALTDALLAVES